MVPCCYWRANGRRLYRTELFCQKECLTVFPQLLLPRKVIRVNRISHPDWVKLCVELNYTPNQNTKFPSATDRHRELNLIVLDLQFLVNLEWQSKKAIKNEDDLIVGEFG